MATPLPDKDHFISLAEAVQIVEARREADKGNPNAERPFAFHRKAYDRILGQPGCVGIRAYPALREGNERVWVLVGVDEKGNDMTSGALAEEPTFCPPICPDSGPLSGNG